MNTQLLAAISTLVNNDQTIDLPNVVRNVDSIQKWYADTKTFITPDGCHKLMADIILFGSEYSGYLKQADEEDKVMLTIGSKHYTAKRKELPGLGKVPHGGHYVFCETGEHPDVQALITEFQAATARYVDWRDFTKNTKQKMENSVEMPTDEFLYVFPELKPFTQSKVKNWFLNLLGAV